MNRASARSESLTYLLNVLVIGRTRCGKLNFALLRWGSLESHRAAVCARSVCPYRPRKKRRPEKRAALFFHIYGNTVQLYIVRTLLFDRHRIVRRGSVSSSDAGNAQFALNFQLTTALLREHDTRDVPS